jgi:hypothetical protein
MCAFEPKLQTLPPSQRRLLPQLEPLQHEGFVLYGGTAVALRLGHRKSVDFDFFTSRPLDQAALVRLLPFLRESTPIQSSAGTFEVLTRERVKVSFFGGLTMGRVGTPEVTSDGNLLVASLDDLMALKLKVILQRNEAKDYVDIAAMCRADVSVERGLATAEQMFSPTFPPAYALKAMTYFEEGDLENLGPADREILLKMASKVRSLPPVTLKKELIPEPELPGR